MQRSGLKGGAVEVGKSVGISVIVTLAAVLLFAFLIKIFSIGSSVITPVNQVIKALAIFLGCLLSLRDTKGWLKGAIAGILVILFTYFIFAIIGEETGFVGASLVILLFLVLGWCMLVVALQSQDRYITLVLASITVWIVGQAFVNIGVVVGLFPVMGVPLPFVSAGGSSLILCLGAAGVTISMMKQQPQIQAEMQRV